MQRIAQNGQGARKEGQGGVRDGEEKQGGAEWQGMQRKGRYKAKKKRGNVREI